MALDQKTQNRLIVIGATVAMLVGVVLLAYPFVSNALLQSAQGNVLRAQQQAVEEQTEGNLDDEREFALGYNQDLLGSRTVVTDPFDEAALRPVDGSYDEALNIAGDGVMGTLYIPRIQVEEPIYHTVDEEVLQKGVGHLEETSLPIGGPSSHSVLSGHTGLPSGKIFDDLDRLEVGDYFIIQVLGEDHAYRIYDIETVLPEETQSLVIQPDRDLCTLVTCTPYGVNSHRLLVHAERCEVPEEWLARGEGETFPSGYTPVMDRTVVPSVLIGLAIAAVIIGGTTAVMKYRQRVAAGAPPFAFTRKKPAERAPRRGAPLRVMPDIASTRAQRRQASAAGSSGEQARAMRPVGGQPARPHSARPRSQQPQARQGRSHAPVGQPQRPHAPMPQQGRSHAPRTQQGHPYAPQSRQGQQPLAGRTSQPRHMKPSSGHASGTKGTRGGRHFRGKA